MTSWYVISRVRTDGRRGYGHASEATWALIQGDHGGPKWRVDAGPFADPGEAEGVAVGLQAAYDVMES